MNNNINNLRFNAVSFSGRGEKSEAEETPLNCDCLECKETEANAADALDAVGRAQVKGAYKFDPENIKNDLEEFDKGYTQALLDIFRQGVYNELVNNGEDPDAAWEKADIAARCFDYNR